MAEENKDGTYSAYDKEHVNYYVIDAEFTHLNESDYYFVGTQEEQK